MDAPTSTQRPLAISTQGVDSWQVVQGYDQLTREAQIPTGGKSPWIPDLGGSLKLTVDRFGTQAPQQSDQTRLEFVDTPTIPFPWVPTVRDRLLEICAGVGDFEGLSQPDYRTLEAAWNVALVTFPAATFPPSVLPTARGGVEFLWRRRGWDVQITVGRDDVHLWARNRVAGTAPISKHMDPTSHGSASASTAKAIREVLGKLSE